MDTELGGERRPTTEECQRLPATTHGSGVAWSGLVPEPRGGARPATQRPGLEPPEQGDCELLLFWQPQETIQLESSFNLESNFNLDYIHPNSYNQYFTSTA